MSHSSINGNNNFYSSDRSQTPTSVRFRSKAKFEPKLLVYVCISEKGLSTPFFALRGLATNGQIYLKECIKNKLEPFIEMYHSDGEYLFWPDLATSHYAKPVIEYLQAKKIDFVQKEENRPNLPECRPVENFWSILKGEVYKNNWQAKDLDQLKQRIRYCLKNIDIEKVKDLFKKIRSQIRKISKKGVIENN